MFYSQDILQTRGGKFGIIWIAATKARKLTKRDYASVNIVRSCDDLVRYITLRGEAVRPGGPIPRFSLYLSAQLMYGIVSVFRKQQNYLFEEVSSLSLKYRLFSVQALDIDLRDQGRIGDVTMPDFLTPFTDMVYPLPENPCFGLQKSLDTVPWQGIPSEEYWPPRLSDPSLSDSPKSSEGQFKAVLGSPFQADPATITLKEVTTPVVPPEELVEPDFACLGPDQPSLDSLDDILRTLAAVGEDPLLQEAQPEGAEPQDAPQIPREGMTTEDMDLGLLPPTEETPQVFPDLNPTVAPPKRPQSPPVTPVTSPIAEPPQARRPRRADYQLELTEVAPGTGSARRRKRHLNFCDANTQMSRRRIRQNIENGHLTSNPFEEPELHSQLVKELFGKPGKKQLCHPRLLPLWSRNAVLARDFDESERGSSSSSSGSARGSPRDVMAAGTIGEPPLSPVVPESPRRESSLEQTLEALRQTNVSGISTGNITRDQPSALSTGVPEDGSLLDGTPSVRRRHQTSFDMSAGLDDVTFVQEKPERRAFANISVLTQLPEEEEQRTEDEESRRSPGSGDSPGKHLSPAGSSSDDDDKIGSPNHRRTLRLIEAHTAHKNITTFAEVCPYTKSRRVAAASFSALLDFVAHQKISVEQDEPYGDIYISRGRHF